MKLPKTYEPKEYEANIYALWESANAFAPRAATGAGDTYSIVMPPPNANGNLHLGHALMAGVEDILIRYHRLKGESTIYIPGADHAGFETWVVFEKQLESLGKSRFDYPREKLYEMVWEFVAAHRGNMESQLRELGVSCDWSKLVFTLDKNVIDCTYNTFKKLWDDDLIYRGKRLVNYCTKHQTGFSDIEVDYEDRKTPLFYMKYGPFELATTRPETMFGDTAVAVHPDDDRHQQYVGQEVEIEGPNDSFKVKVVADKHVDPEFGTGVVKITPAHDFNDWEVGERHGLPIKQVISLEGKMTEDAGRFAGLPVSEARQAVVQALEEKGLLIKVDKNYKNRVGVCYKCKTVIEPMLLDQWFVRMEPLAKRAVRSLEEGRINFYPANKGRVLINYLNNIKDWNISRQIPWGIPVPAFCNVEEPSEWIFDTEVESEYIERDGKKYRRDPDTFDTWFSSGQWPFITTLHNPGGKLPDHYPTSVMETGHDILDRWVARMIMLGLYVTDDIPFKDVYLHGMVLDPHGQKMSKSKGNVINPQEAIREFGSDALRMGLVASRSAGINQAFSPGAVVAGRNFCNKIWNMARYVEDKVGEQSNKREAAPMTLADHWILERLNAEANRIAELLDNYRFSEAFEAMYHFVWDDVADWYIEASKADPNVQLMAYLLEQILIIAHPFAPFVTETIWQTLAWEKGMVISGKWPKVDVAYDKTKAKEFSGLQELVSEARAIINELQQGKQKLIYIDDPLLDDNRDLVVKLANLGGLEKVSEKRGLRLAIAHHEVWLDIDSDTLDEHKTKLAERLKTVQSQITKLNSRLANKSYVENAPENIVLQTRGQLADQQKLEERLKREIEVVGS